jgi:hypothetical protein
MKFKQIVEALPSLQKLAKQDLSIKKLYKISKLLGSLEHEIAFYNAQRNKIFEQHCDIVGNQYVARAGEEEALNAEIGELLDTDVECDVQEVVIGIDEDVKLSYNDLVALAGLVRIEEDV